MSFNFKTQLKKQQFYTLRNYKYFTWANIETDVNENEDLQTLFGDVDPDVISEKLLRGLNTIIKKHVQIKRVQL